VRPILRTLRSFGYALDGLLYPQLCQSCERQLPAEAPDALCLTCLASLPYTNYHELTENPITDRLAGRIPLTFGGAFLFYRPNTKTQRLIPALKYYNRPEIGHELGRQYGKFLKNVAVLRDVTGIIPVPLHPRRQHQRGYNQALRFAEGLADSWEKPVLAAALKRQVFEASQTRKGLQERIKNVAQTFVATGRPALADQHVLLVDDVLTTGATLESCAEALLEKYANLRISVATIALAE